MQKTIDETNYRREKQIDYNKKQGLQPKPLNKSIENALSKSPIISYHYDNTVNQAADFKEFYNSKEAIEKKIKENKKLMEQAAKELNFMEAAKYRDKIKELEELKIKQK